MVTIIKSKFRSIRQAVQSSMDRQLLTVVFESLYLHITIIIDEEILIDFVSQEAFVLIGKKIYLERLAEVTCLVFMSYSIHEG
jgi:hypothetical protein